jgi:hypothetical protein
LDNTTRHRRVKNVEQKTVSYCVVQAITGVLELEMRRHLYRFVAAHPKTFSFLRI